mgnify:CR=1 FL=1
MKRTTQHERPDAILCADFHLREDQPTCRIDDFWTVQWEKVDFISDLQRKYDCPVLMAGDLFNHWKPSPYLLTTAIKHLPAQLYLVHGNHDLPQHSLEQSEKSGVGVLEAAQVLDVLPTCHWGQMPDKGSLFEPELDVLVWHVMTFPKGTSPWPGCTDLNAEQILEKYPQFPLILCGHNHATFTEEYEGRLLVNPGSLTRQDADQENHEPCVFLWYAKTNTVKKVILPHNPGVISREHIDRPQERHERMEAYIERMNLDWKIKLKFKDNLEIFFRENPVPKNIQELIWISMH